MSSLNILCAICSEYFQNTDIIYSTRCGHVFHKCCLFQWLKCSRTCPQCRKQCMQHNCHQLFINFIETSPDNNEPEMELPKIFEWIYIHHDIDLADDLSFAFKFGQDEEGNDIYAARGHFDGDLIPAYYVPRKRAVIAPWGFESHCLTDDIELLDISNDDAEYKWVACSNGDIPENAFATGRTVMGDVLYTARAYHEGILLYGKLHQRYNLAYMPYKDKEVCNGHYEILVRIPKKATT
ncbi:uncharacterized protein LOC135960805 [Calliphora vicina]|uniref:uncharacterized protein LOC135960805 n=1 Tax=Calliphora vicina TaxID=7373 RepID=UPI00325AB32C